MTRTWNWRLAPASPALSARTVHALGLVAVVAVLGYWGANLHPPAAVPAAAPAAPAAQADPAARTVAAWLGPGQLRLDVAVVGLMRRDDRAVAVLKVNGAPPKAFMTGETLMRDVTLVAVDAGAVTIERAGATTRIAAPARPDPGPPGIVRVP